MTWFFLALAAALLVSSNTILQKKALLASRSVEFSWILACCNAILSLPFFLFADFSNIDAYVLAVIFMGSLITTGSLFLSTKSLKHAEVSETSPLFALSPLVAALLAFLFLAEKITQVHFIGLLLMAGGIFFLEAKNMRISSGIFRKGREKYLLFTLLCVFLFGIGTVFDRVILSSYHVDPLAYLAIIHMILAMNFSIIFFVGSISKQDLAAEIRKTWKIILLISVLTYFQRYFYANAVQVAASLGLVVAVKRLSALFNVVAAGRFFHEQDIARKAAATAVIVVGTALLF
jgi:drug/metabolite transporter (DMT)-like permease